MWYVEINDKIIPIPYKTYDACMEAIRHYQETMIGIRIRPVLE
jgi:hypothetical protein